VVLHKEGTAEGSLGVDIQRNGDTKTFTQDGLTKQIIKALGLNTKYSTAKSTPAGNKALGKDLLHPFSRILVIYNQNPIMHNRWEWVIYNQRKRVPKISPPFLFSAPFLL
jgi:hypothetical protein